MPVGFTNPGQFTVNPPGPKQFNPQLTEPWFLRFSRFYAEDGTQAGGAHGVSPQPGGQAKGGGVTIAHTDVGYENHPELTHGPANPLHLPGKTFTKPKPSWLTPPTTLLKYSQVTASVSISNRVQVSGGVSHQYVWPDDGKDLLSGFNASHGVSTASTMISAPGKPAQTSQPPYNPQQNLLIEGGAPDAKLWPIRVSDSVIIDPQVADNLANAISHIAITAKAQPEIGVISISMGFPGGSKYKNYPALRGAMREAADAGVIICAAAAQTLYPLAQAMEENDPFRDFADSVAAPFGDGADIVGEAARVAKLTEVMARATGLVLTPQSTMAGLVQEIQARAAAAGKTATQIESFLRTLESIAETYLALGHLGASYVRAQVGYPATDINTIACAACDYKGDPMADGFYGPAVDITAPGVSIHVAKVQEAAGGGPEYFTATGDGTSYATSITAAACALWQAHHGRASLLATYSDPLMVHLFRYALKHSAAKSVMGGDPATWDAANRGFGFLDAKALLNQPLPGSDTALLAALLSEGLISAVQHGRLQRKANRILRGT